MEPRQPFSSANRALLKWSSRGSMISMTLEDNPTIDPFTGGFMHGAHQFLSQRASARMTSQDFILRGTFRNMWLCLRMGYTNDSPRDLFLLSLWSCCMGDSLCGRTSVSWWHPSVSPSALRLADAHRKSSTRHGGERHCCPHP